MAKKELSPEIFKKCLNDKINLFGIVEGELEVRTRSDKGSGDYVAEVYVNFGGPFFKKVKTSGYVSASGARKESIQNFLEYLRGVVSPNLVDYELGQDKIILQKNPYTN